MHGRPVQRKTCSSEPVVLLTPKWTICVFAVIADEYTWMVKNPSALVVTDPTKLVD